MMALRGIIDHGQSVTSSLVWSDAVILYVKTADP